ARGNDKRDAHALPGTQGDVPADAENRIQHKPLSAAWRGGGPRRALQRASPPDKGAPVGIESQILIVFSAEAMGHKDGQVALPAGPAVRKERVMLRHRLGPDEKLVEGRMLQVCPVRRHGELDVAGELEPAGANGPVDEGDPPDLHVVFRGHDDLCFDLYAVVDAPEYR